MTTPLTLSLKTTFPDAVIDYLVFEGTEIALLKNPLVSRVITVSGKRKNSGFIWKLLRQYDLSVAAYPSDRTAIAAAVTGKRSVGLIYRDKKAWWKRLILNACSYCDDRMHVVSAILSLTDTIRVKPVPRALFGFDDDDLEYARKSISARRYVVLHPYSMGKYKYWPAENWSRLALLILENTDCTPVFTVTPAATDKVYLDEILSGVPEGVMIFPSNTINQFAAALKDAVAYVGLDTATTHIAAALDKPTIAIYGPTLTRYWAPWPNGCEEKSPFSANRGIQRKDYVTVVQKDWPCVPCNKNECRISDRGRMECLYQLTPDEVFDELLRKVNL